MKSLLRNTVIHSFILFFLPFLVPGFHVTGGFWTFIIGGFILSLLTSILKPILSIISFPVNFLTLGLFSLIINGLIIYLLTIFIPQISIQPFVYEKMNIWIFSADKISFNTFFAYVYVA